MGIPPFPSPLILLPEGGAPRGLFDLAKVPALISPFTLDIWYRGKHRRATNVTISSQGPGKILLLGKNSLKRRVISWVDEKKFRMEQLPPIQEIGYCIPVYNETNLICYTAAHKLVANGTPIQFVLYPAGYELIPGALKVVGWQNSISPIMGNPTW